MPLSVIITRDDFEPGILIEGAKRRKTGAVVIFLGIVRDDGIEEIELEAYEEAAMQELQSIQDEAMQKFSLLSAEIIHRIGVLRVGDHILLIVVGAAHRQEAFLGCEYILEQIKMTVPIWKKEVTLSGTRWVKGDYWP